MPDSVCAKCLCQGRHLAASSENAMVDYYRCDRCGHVWAIDKKDKTGKARDVTIAVAKKDKAV